MVSVFFCAEVSSRAPAMAKPTSDAYVSRGGDKLEAALDRFGFDLSGKVCADLGSHVGGFVDCLLQRGAARVHSVDTSYGILAWTLRKDPRVVVHERTNAMHVELAERVEVVTIDVGWTPQAKVLPSAARMLAPDGRVITLIKPQYEAAKDALVGGVVPDTVVESVVARVLSEVATMGWTLLDHTESPIRGHGGNREFLAMLLRSPSSA